jgi:alkaline phosphatase D
MMDQPIWNTIVDNSPDLFIHLGDATYPDVNDEMTALIEPWPNPETLNRIRETYQIATSKPEFQRLQAQVPVLAVWDDHDYGINDGGGNFSLKEQTQQLFLDHYGEPDNSWRRTTPGIYDSHIFGSDGKRVQVILLDIRYFRSPPVLDARSDEEKQALNIDGRYAPSNNPEATVLGRQAR